MAAHIGERLEVGDVGKVALLTGVVLAAVVLILAGEAELDDVDWVFASVVSFVMGNGIAVARKRAPMPLFAPRLDDREVATPTGPRQITAETLAVAAQVAAQDEAHTAQHTGETPATPGPATGTIDHAMTRPSLDRSIADTDIWANQPRRPKGPWT